MVAKTIGTHVSFAWETVAGQRPTTGYKKWCDCTAHPDLNPAREQIETTTLCQTNNKTYEDGLRDYGDLGFGANLTNETMDLFIGAEGYVTMYPSKNNDGLRLWACIDIKGINKSYYIPVKPQDFGLPEGEAGSNKYDLTVNFSAVGDAGWYDDPIYDDEVTRMVTFNGYTASGVKIDVIKNDRVIRSLVTTSETLSIDLAVGTYVAIARKDGNNSQIKDVVVGEEAVTVTFTEFTA